MNKLIASFYSSTEKIKKLYPRREDNEILDTLILLCQKMISAAPKTIKAFHESTGPDVEMIQRFQDSINTMLPLSKGEDGVAKVMLEHIKQNEALIHEEEKKKPVPWESFLGPVHIGYEKLFQIYMDLEAYQEAVNIALSAKNEHWSGDWDRKIEKAKKKLT